MKNILFVTLILSVMFVVPFSAYAIEEDLPDPGLTPESPLYFAERWGEGIRTFFTFGNSAKARRYASLADERLAEFHAMLEEEKDEHADTALRFYERTLARAVERADRAQTSEETQGRVAESTGKHLVVLESVLARVPEQARDAIERAIERSRTGHEAALERLAGLNQERAGEVGAKILKKYLHNARDAVGDVDTDRLLDGLERYRMRIQEVEEGRGTFREAFTREASEAIEGTDDLQNPHLRERTRSLRQEHQERLRTLQNDVNIQDSGERVRVKDIKIRPR